MNFCKQQVLIITLFFPLTVAHASRHEITSCSLASLGILSLHGTCLSDSVNNIDDDGFILIKKPVGVGGKYIPTLAALACFAVLKDPYRLVYNIPCDRALTWAESFDRAITNGFAMQRYLAERLYASVKGQMPQDKIIPLRDKALKMLIALDDPTGTVYKYAQTADDELLRFISAAGLDVNPQQAVLGVRLGSPLSVAVQTGTVRAIAPLMALGADSDVCSWGTTPLIDAIYANNLEAVQALIAGGARVKAKDSMFGESPLVWAIEKSSWEIVDELLKAGADAEVRDALGATLLQIARQRGDEAIIRLLVARQVPEW